MENNLESVFNNAMDLVMDLKEYIENSKKIKKAGPLDASDIFITEEVSKMTSNITAMVSWLFMFKALKNNEISEQTLIAEGNELLKGIEVIPDETSNDDYPAAFIELKEQMTALRQDVIVLYRDFIHTSMN